MNDVDEVAKELNKKVQKIADRIFQLSQENLIEDGHIDTGTMLKTANINRGDGYAMITYPAEYADNIEYGRQPGTQPPLEPLIKWCRRKLKLKDDKEAEKVAWAIVVSIKKRGIAPTRFMRNAIDQALAED